MQARKVLGVVLVTMGVAVFGVGGPAIAASTTLPDFGSMKDVREKKQRFFGFIYPLVVKANQQVLEQRSRLLALKNKLRSGLMPIS